MKLSFFASLASLGLMLAAPVCAQDKPLALARATDLVSKMTLEEKAGQMINHAPAIPRLGAGTYRLSLGGGQPADGAKGMSLVVSAGD